MSTETFIRAELSKIERIAKNETYLASERAGHSVDPRSPEIQCRVADILLAGAGEYLRNLIDHDYHEHTTYRPERLHQGRVVRHRFVYA